MSPSGKDKKVQVEKRRLTGIITNQRPDIPKKTSPRPTRTNPRPGKP